MLGHISNIEIPPVVRVINNNGMKADSNPHIFARYVCRNIERLRFYSHENNWFLLEPIRDKELNINRTKNPLHKIYANFQLVRQTD